MHLTVDIQSGPTETPAWYAVRVRARHEAVVAAALAQKGYQILLPQCAVRKQWSDRVKVVTLALFPGYVFVNLDIRSRLALLKTTGVIQIVGAGGTFLPVDDQEIFAIQRMVASGEAMEPWPYTSIGRRVRIDAGPLRGVEGLLTDVDSRRRLIVSVSLLQRSVAVLMDAAVLTPVDGLEIPDGLHWWKPALSVARPA